MKNLLLLLLCAFCFKLNAEGPKYRVINVPVQRNGLLLREPWVGGMDSPQFSTCDLNNDGVKDLFVFDRVSNKVLTYLGNGTQGDTMFVYAPQYEGVFPAGLNNWVLLRDYNHDGVPDIFTHANTGIMVYKGSIVAGNLHFEIVSNLLMYPAPAPDPPTNIWTTITDIPVIADVNGDGDLDILSYNIYGATIGYCENQTAEHLGDPHYAADSLKYELYSTCWGNIAQDASSNSIALNVSCKGQATDTNGGEPRHTGNSIYSFVDPNTKLTNLLNGNIGFDNLLFLKNCGTLGFADVCHWDSLFPVCGNPMVMTSYPAAYGVPINHKTYDDVFVSPNVYSPIVYAGGAARNTHNVSYFKSTGDTACYFDYQTDSFLVHHMLDFGTNARPVLYDFDGDSLLDIVVGNYGYFNKNHVNSYQSALAIYKNTGTKSSPDFTEVTLDYDSMSKFNLLGISPAFGDLDGDGKPDLLIGDNTGYLHYFKNRGTTGSSFPVMDSVHFFNLKTGTYSAPFIYDVNGDSLNDIVVGQYNGKLNYFWNFGMPTAPKFHKDSVVQNFGNVNVCYPGYHEGYSQPFIMDSAGQKRLYVGSEQGLIFKYNLETPNLKRDTLQIINGDVIGQNAGYNSTIAVADLNNDGNLEYLIGTSTGGLILYSDSLWDSSTVLNIPEPKPVLNELLIYPNPTKDYFVCSIPGVEFTNPKIEVYTLMGEKVTSDLTQANNKLVVKTTGWANGFYVVKVTEGAKNYNGKILLLH